MNDSDSLRMELIVGCVYFSRQNVGRKLAVTWIYAIAWGRELRDACEWCP